MKLFLLLCFILFSQIIFAQTPISGRVSDTNNNPLPGANIFIKDSYDGISSALDGKFDFTTEEEGDVILIVSFIGYKQVELPLTLTGKKIELEITLEEEAKELGAVVISAGAFEASDENKAVILRPLDIVTTGAEADIYSALETLPGTQQVGEAEGLFVRGGSAAETKTIVDEMIVQNPFYSSVPDIPSRSRFSPFLFKGTVFSTGGYSAQYGQALSSVLVLKTQDLAPDTRTAINLMALGLGAAHTQRWENTSLAFEGGYYNLGPYFEVQKQRTEWKKAPESFEGSLNLRQKAGGTGMLKAFASHSYSELSLFSPNLNDLTIKDFFKMTSNNFFFNTNYRDILGEDWAVFGGYSFSTDNDNIGLTTDHVTQNEQLHTLKVTITKNVTANSFLTFGGEFQNIIYKDVFNGFQFMQNELYLGGYIETDIFFTNDFAARIGVRAEHSKLINKYNFAPRLSLAYRLGQYDQLNFAYGQFYQTPTRDFLVYTQDFDFEKAAHYIFNYQYIGGNRTFRIEAYYKDYDKLARGTVYTYPYFNLPVIPFSSTGSGYAKGIDIFWRDSETFEFTDYWLSYSFLDTKREFKNYPSIASPTFATPHTFSVVLKRWIQSITTSVGITYSFATGRPYFNPNNPEFLGDRGKNYNNMSLNVSYLTTLFDSFTIIFFSVDNLIGYNNIYGYRYSDNGKLRMPVLSPALRSAFIGMFISLGEAYPF